MHNCVFKALLLFYFILFGVGEKYLKLSAQDLDPRAYFWIPKDATVLISGYGYSGGDVVTDATVQIQDVKANLHIGSLGLAHSFSFFGMTSQVLVVAPYAWAKVSGEVFEKEESIQRNGLMDLRMRWSVLFYGAPAMSLPDRMKEKQKTVLGASISVVAPTGQYFSDKLINLGTNRWAIKPEIALSQSLGKGWYADLYAGVWLFSDNNDFFPGEKNRTQNPLGTFQGHLSYNIRALLWIALDATYYVGGNSYVNGITDDNRQSNSRIGLTAVIPTSKLSALKIAYSTGAVVRIGQDFDTFSIGWSKTWFKGIKKN
ncbi:MAG: transporter [Lutimonas sp.]